MGISDYLKAKLSDLPGIEGATSELIGGEQVIHINGAEAHTGPFASDTEIERAIRSALNMLDPEATEPAEPNVTPMPPVALIEEPKKDEPAPVQAAPAKPVPIAKNRSGASFLANMIRERQASFKERFAKAGDKMESAFDEMEVLAVAAEKEAEHAIAEVADLRAALGMNSNGEPE
jgi:hypothetical protein